MIIDLNLFQIFEDNNETINNITLILLYEQNISPCGPLGPPPPHLTRIFFGKF